MFIKNLIIGLLSFYFFDPKKNGFRHAEELQFSVQIERLFEKRKQRESERKKAGLYPKRKWLPRKIYVDRTYKIKGNNPKNKRYSNQQMLRRMYRSS